MNGTHDRSTTETREDEGGLALAVALVAVSSAHSGQRARRSARTGTNLACRSRSCSWETAPPTRGCSAHLDQAHDR